MFWCDTPDAKCNFKNIWCHIFFRFFASLMVFLDVFWENFWKKRFFGVFLFFLPPLHICWHVFLLHTVRDPKKEYPQKKSSKSLCSFSHNKAEKFPKNCDFLRFYAQFRSKLLITWKIWYLDQFWWLFSSFRVIPVILRYHVSMFGVAILVDKGGIYGPAPHFRSLKMTK